MSFVGLLSFGATVGFGATIFADFIAVLRQGWTMTHGFYCLVGRWVGSLPSTGLIHNDIRASPPIAGERILGWGAHVILGVIYGIVFAVIFGPAVIEAPKFWLGLGFGLVTVMVPWLIFQPLFGWGFGMSKAPEPWKMRLKGVINHAVFGMGLWLSAELLNAVLRVELN